MKFETREIGPAYDAAWDALAGCTPESGFMQSSAWARFKRLEGYETWRLGLFEGGELVGGAAILAAPCGACAGSDTRGFLICPEGPIVPWHDAERARAALRAITAAARDRAAATGAMGLRIEPHLAPPAPSLLRNWTRAPVDLTPVHTLVLDLTLSEDELLARMTPKGRYNLRLSVRHGVEVTASSDMASLADFYRLFDETARRNQFYAEPCGFFLNLGAELFPAGMASVFTAWLRGEPLAALLVIYFGRRATYLYGGSSSAHREVMPSYALHAAAMREARNRGCLEYDLYGYDPFGLTDHLYAGISRFKRQWGGARRDTIGARDLVFYDQLADVLVSTLAAPTMR